MGKRTIPFALAATAIALTLGFINMGIGTMHPALQDDHVMVKRLDSFTDKKHAVAVAKVLPLSPLTNTPTRREQSNPLTVPPEPPISPLPHLKPSMTTAFPKELVPRPPLNEIIQGWNVTGDPSWLLNFAILGFPKCGTSTMMHHLSNHSQIQIFQDERCELGANQQVPLIRDLYNDLAPGDYVRGIKCPMALENTELSMRNMQTYFPKANYLVGIRHPVLWFESFYNFRVHNNAPMLPPDQLVGRCFRKAMSVCTFRGNFHLFLSNLGKTNMSDPAELQYIAPKIRRSMDPLNMTQQKVFLYDVSQLSDPDPVREAQLLVDLQGFLGLTEPISPMIWFKPGKKHDNKLLQEVNSKKIDICEDQYINLRSLLMEQSRDASTWITKFFINAPDVVVSSKDHFANVLMESWLHDPCLERKKKHSTAAIANTTTLS